MGLPKWRVCHFQMHGLKLACAEKDFSLWFDIFCLIWKCVLFSIQPLLDSLPTGYNLKAGMDTKRPGWWASVGFGQEKGISALVPEIWDEFALRERRSFYHKNFTALPISPLDAWFQYQILWFFSFYWKYFFLPNMNWIWFLLPSLLSAPLHLSSRLGLLLFCISVENKQLLCDNNKIK